MPALLPRWTVETRGPAKASDARVLIPGQVWSGRRTLPTRPGQPAACTRTSGTVNARHAIVHTVRDAPTRLPRVDHAAMQAPVHVRRGSRDASCRPPPAGWPGTVNRRRWPDGYAG